MHLLLPLMLALLLPATATAAAPTHVRTDNIARFWATYRALCPALRPVGITYTMGVLRTG